MDSHQQKSRFLRSRGLNLNLGKTARVVAALGLTFSLFGPMPFGGDTPTAEADLLKWDDLHPPYMDNLDTTGARTVLPTFGTFAAHPITVAPNGDLFSAGKLAALVGPNVYKSTDGGLTWTASNNTQGGNLLPATSRITSIAVAPKYPQDNRVYAAFSDAVVGDDATDGLALSTNGGNTFVIIADGAAATASKADLSIAAEMITSVALSTDFDGSTNAGEVTIGYASGAGSGTGYRTTTLTGAGLFSGTAAATLTEGAGVVTAGTKVDVLSLAYSTGDVIRLAALVSATGGANVGTYGVQRTSATTWPTAVAGDANFMNAAIAINGKIAFPDTYTSGGAYYAGWTNSLTAPTAAATGVYRFDGSSWAIRNGTGAPVGMAITDIAVSGSGSTAAIFAAEGGSANTRIFKSTNAGSSFTNRNYGGQDPVTGITAGAAAIATVGVGKDFATSQRVFVGTNASGGGLLISTNGGQNWVGTQLTNTLAAFLTSVIVGAGDTVFALAGGGMVFKTTNFSSANAGWKLVERTPIGTIVVPAGFASHNTVFLRRATAGDTPILRSSDGGESFGTGGLSSPDANTVINTLSCASATQCWAGMADGKIFITSNGASSWNPNPTDVGDNVRQFLRSPGFATDNTMFAEVDLSGGTEIMMSADGGVTWTAVGSSVGAWGSGVGTGSIVISPNYATDKMLWYRPAVPAANTEVWRKKVGDAANWAKIGSGTSDWGTIRVTAAAGKGDGLLLQMLDRTASNIRYTFYPMTVDEGTWSKRTTANTTLPFVTAGTTTALSFDAITGGTRIRAIQPSTGRVIAWTDTAAFLAGPTLIQPADKTSVATNVGTNGVPVTFTWTAVDRVQCYDLQIALDQKFDIPVLDVDTNAAICPSSATNVPSSAAAVIAQAAVSFSQSNTYYWRVRSRGVGPSMAVADLTRSQGPWSPSFSFAVGSQGAPTLPEPRLPADGTTMPNLGPIQLTWNNPSGTAQYHIQVTPLSNDGPGIDLIIGDLAQVASAMYTIMSPVMGQGNYVLLPGATYNWSVRTTNKQGNISSTDPSWGPWSVIRTFKTPRPSAASLTLNPVTPSATPTLSWKDSNTSNFYYEIQLSQDRTFNVDPATATAAVYWNLIHGGVTDPLNSWKTAGLTLENGKTYFWRVRQRVQATPNGPDQVGISWTATASFVIP